MKKQVVLKAAGLTLAQVMWLTFYTTDVNGLLANRDVITTFLHNADCRPASTLLGVTDLAFGILVEIEAIAVE